MFDENLRSLSVCTAMLVALNPFLTKPWVFTCLKCKSFENTVGKGEIARNEQFHLFPQCDDFIGTVHHGDVAIPGPSPFLWHLSKTMPL